MNQLAGGAVRRQIEDLSLGGHYDVASGVLDAADFEAPQRRTRLVFIGVERRRGGLELPVGTGISQLLRIAPRATSLSLAPPRQSAGTPCCRTRGRGR